MEPPGGGLEIMLFLVSGKQCDGQENRQLEEALDTGTLLWERKRPGGGLRLAKSKDLCSCEGGET